MKRPGLFQFDKKFKHHPIRYLFQCGLATCYIIVVLMALDVLDQTAIIATLGASAFIIFVRPKSYTSKTRIVIGGYIIGITIGIFFAYLVHLEILTSLFMYEKVQIVLFTGIAIGITIFIMAITNTEHPPAAAMTLGLILNDWNLAVILFIAFCVALLICVRLVLKPYLLNLM